MKKTLLFAALMCCIVSASAQHFKKEPQAHKSLEETIQRVEKMNRHENVYTTKLDSVTGEGMRILYEYDDRLNCTKESRYYSEGVKDWWLATSYENTYDEQNRLTSVIYRDYYYNSTTKEEYTYNAQNLIVEIIAAYPSGENWIPFIKWCLDYDENGNNTQTVRFNYYNGWTEHSKMVREYENGLLQTEMFYDYISDGDWQPESKTDYAYNAQGLCTEEIISYWYPESEWNPSYKDGYSYNEQGLCCEKIHYDRFNEEWNPRNRNTYEYDNAGNLVCTCYYGRTSSALEWTLTDKTEYSYDTNNNCTAFHDYYYYSGHWHFDGGYEMTYDLTVSIDQTAGLDRLWEAMEIAVPIYNKILQIKALETEEESSLMDCYYSDYNDIAESTESPVAVWPNPATEDIHIEGLEAVEVQVYNALGQLEKTVRDANEINVAGLAKGVYLMRITDIEGKKHVARVAVKR